MSSFKSCKFEMLWIQKRQKIKSFVYSHLWKIMSTTYPNPQIGHFLHSLFSAKGTSIKDVRIFWDFWINIPTYLVPMSYTLCTTISLCPIFHYIPMYLTQNQTSFMDPPKATNVCNFGPRFVFWCYRCLLYSCKPLSRDLSNPQIG